MAVVTTTLGVPGAYAGEATAWENEATPVYGPLAAHLLAVRPAAVGPIRFAGCRVVDAGAGSGVVGDVLRVRGAEVISVDFEPDMVRHLAAKGPAVLADVRNLPFPSDDFDVAVAAFVVNHLPDPARGLAELGRVTRRRGWVLASVFGNTEPRRRSPSISSRHGSASLHRAGMWVCSRRPRRSARSTA